MDNYLDDEMVNNIIENSPKDNYTPIANKVIEDTELGNAEFRLFSYLSSKVNINGFEFSNATLRKYGQVGKNTISVKLKKLEELGYISRKRKMRADGTLAGGWVYTIYAQGRDMEREAMKEENEDLNKKLDKANQRIADLERQLKDKKSNSGKKEVDQESKEESSPLGSDIHKGSISSKKPLEIIHYFNNESGLNYSCNGNESYCYLIENLLQTYSVKELRDVSEMMIWRRKHDPEGKKGSNNPNTIFGEKFPIYLGQLAGFDKPEIPKKEPQPEKKPSKLKIPVTEEQKRYIKLLYEIAERRRAEDSRDSSLREFLDRIDLKDGEVVQQVIDHYGGFDGLDKKAEEYGIDIFNLMESGNDSIEYRTDENGIPIIPKELDGMISVGEDGKLKISEDIKRKLE
jgi:DNA-binding PadR family transcriptional regulator